MLSLPRHEQKRNHLKSQLPSKRQPEPNKNPKKLLKRPLSWHKERKISQPNLMSLAKELHRKPKLLLRRRSNNKN